MPILSKLEYIKKPSPPGGGEYEAGLVGLHVRIHFIDRLPPTQGWNRNGS